MDLIKKLVIARKFPITYDVYLVILYFFVNSYLRDINLFVVFDSKLETSIIEFTNIIGLEKMISITHKYEHIDVLSYMQMNISSTNYIMNIMKNILRYKLRNMKVDSYISINCNTWLKIIIYG